MLRTTCQEDLPCSTLAEIAEAPAQSGADQMSALQALLERFPDGATKEEVAPGTQHA